MTVLGNESQIVEDVVSVLGGTCHIVETSENYNDFIDNKLKPALLEASQ